MLTNERHTNKFNKSFKYENALVGNNFLIEISQNLSFSRTFSADNVSGITRGFSEIGGKRISNLCTRTFNC